MKLLKILICSALVMLAPMHAQGKYLTVKAGMYDFTTEAARDFYFVSPLVELGANVIEFNRVQILTLQGVSYRKVPYNESEHTVMLFPTSITMLYNLPNLGSKLRPYFGGGIGTILKYDKNQWLDKAHIAFSYGYNMLFGFSYRINTRYALGFNMQYFLFSPPNMESINLSGIYTSLELRYALGEFRVLP